VNKLSQRSNLYEMSVRSYTNGITEVRFYQRQFILAAVFNKIHKSIRTLIYVNPLCSKLYMRNNDTGSHPIKVSMSFSVSIFE